VQQIERPKRIISGRRGSDIDKEWARVGLRYNSDSFILSAQKLPNCGQLMCAPYIIHHRRRDELPRQTLLVYCQWYMRHFLTYWHWQRKEFPVARMTFTCHSRSSPMTRFNRLYISSSVSTFLWACCWNNLPPYTIDFSTLSSFKGNITLVNFGQFLCLFLVYLICSV